jgi:hypothetical protein
MMLCDVCGFRFYDCRLSESEGNRYYGNYRDESYQLEPFYTQQRT